MVPGLQEAAAESFDKMLKPKVPEVEDVSKMLANGLIYYMRRTGLEPVTG